MNLWCRRFLFAILWVGVLLPVAAQAQATASQSQADQPSDQKQDKKQDKKKNNSKKPPSQRQLAKELATPYKQWLGEDVVYLITDQERRAFLQLATNEEREQFIEQFWQRRNPDPDSLENEFKEEHYRRIAYVNEHFASGAPGWKTDRGRIYIVYGPPDTLATHTMGEIWDRPPELGGGETKTYPYEEWSYHHIDGIGDNVELEFVDTTNTGEFHFTTNPSEKDAMTNVDNEGLTDAEAGGFSSKSDRMYDPGMNPQPLPGFTGVGLKEFDKIDLEAKLFTPPQVKFKDLEAIVSSRIVRDQIQFSYRFDFMRISGDTVLVPITVQIPNNQMSFKTSDDVHTATLNLFARITTVTGRVVQTFEDDVRRDFPDSLLQQSLRGFSLYQKAVPLRPGLYRLDIVLKDTTSNNVGVVTTRLAVPVIDEDKLAASSLILADNISPVAARDIGVGQFVIGSVKVRPKVDQSFNAQQPMGIFMQFYNLKVDDKTHKNDATVDMQVFQGDRSLAHKVMTSTEMKQSGEQLTVDDTFKLGNLAPGKYRIEIKVTDALANETVSRSADFTVTPVEDKNTAAQSLP